LENAIFDTVFSQNRSVAEDSNEAGHMFENSGEQEDEDEDDEETPAIGEWYPLSDRLEVRLETEFTLLSLSL